MRKLLAIFCLSWLCLPAVAVGAIEIKLTYKLDGIQHTDSLMLGIAGKQAPEYDRRGEASSASVGDFEWSFSSSSGLNYRLGISYGHSTFRIGRYIGSGRITYFPVSSPDNSRLQFGDSYEMDTSVEAYTELAGRLTDIRVSSTPWEGKKITNMTKGDITVGYGTWNDPKVTIPKGKAMIISAPITRFLDANWNTGWEVRSEQDWATVFTPFTYESFSFDLPFIANMLIYEPSEKPTIHPLKGALVYGDMGADSGGKILYGSNGQPLYAVPTIVTTNIMMATWWDFSHDDWGESPQALINNEVVCMAHATTHIISHNINAHDMEVYGNTGRVDFTMTLIPQEGYPGGACTMRCWGEMYGASEAGYTAAPAGHKAEVSAGTKTATFKLTINTKTGDWAVSPS